MSDALKSSGIAKGKPVIPIKLVDQSTLNNVNGPTTNKRTIESNVLVEDGGRTLLRPGDVCAWAEGVANGHHLINESEADCSFVAISAGTDRGGSYPDIDMMWTGDGAFRHKDGTPYPTQRMA